MVELAENSLFYIAPQPLDTDAEKILNLEGLQILTLVESYLAALPEISWTERQLENYVREIAEERDLKLGKIAQPLRASLTGKSVSPSVFEIMHILGKDNTLARVRSHMREVKH